MTMRKSFPVSLPTTNGQGTGFNPLLYPACFLQPAKMSDVRSWQQHIPFAFAAIQLLQPRRFVELGTHKGDSYLAFCQAIAALGLPTVCYAVDTWAGDDQAGTYDDSVYTELAAYHDRCYSGFSRLIRSTFDQAVEYFADASIDLLHIDGLHVYDAVKHDFETWLPKLSDRAVVIFHDVNVREREFGVWRFWNEIREHYPSFAFTHGNGLGILAVGPRIPQTLSPLFEIDESAAAIVRQFYFALGSRIENTAALAAESASRLNTLRRTIGALDHALDDVGFKHELITPTADEHRLSAHAMWTHRALTQLAKDVHERNLRIQDLEAEASGLKKDLACSQIDTEFARNQATMSLENLRNLAQALDTTLRAAGFADDSLPSGIDLPVDGNERKWRERLSGIEGGVRKLADDGHALRGQIGQLHKESQHLRTHVANLELGTQALRNSLSWKLSAPLRLFGKPIAPRVRGSFEQKMYSLYYAIPGLNPRRKHALIQWLHRHASFLTKNTLSYHLYKQAQKFQAEQASRSLESAREARMDQARADALIATWREPPTISIAMPVYNVDARWLEAAVNSVRNQFYPHWQLCIADDASTRKETQDALKRISALNDKRIRITRLKRNVGIAAASNCALDLASGDFVGLLDNDDELTRDALLEMARRIVKDDPDLLYSDEDKLDEDGSHVEPHFKPDFSPDYLFSNNYICHFSVIRREILQRIGGFRPGFDGAQDYELILRVSEQTQKIAHIPMVLYHWRKIPGSTSADSAAKPQTSDAGRRALAASLQRRGIDASVEAGPYPNTFRVMRRIAGNPEVCIIIPFRDKPDLLDTCVSSILDKTRYANYEILCVDNGSIEPATTSFLRRIQARDKRVRVIRYDAPFNYSTINNFGASQTSAPYLLLLNNDTEVISPDWLESMLEHAQRPEVGLVGAKLLYADETIQHAGVVIALGGVAGHAHLFLQGDHPGYFARAQLIQNFSAVTFACAMIRREVFEQLGGLNEKDLKIAFNDVDFCLRAREAGYLIVYTPYACLHHYESKSRGFEDTPEKLERFNTEVDYMLKRHAAIIRDGDPYYNPNLLLRGGPENFHPDASYVSGLPD